MKFIIFVKLELIVNGYLQTQLHLAILNGRTSIAKKLIELGANVTAKDINGETPPHCFSSSFFNEKDSDIMKNDVFSSSPSSVIHDLLRNGANPEELNNSNHSSIQEAE